MNIYYSKYFVIGKVTGSATAYIWVVDENEKSALSKSINYISLYASILEMIIPPIIVTEKDFIERDIELKHYNESKKKGVSMIFFGVLSDSSGLIKRNLNITNRDKILEIKKRERLNGRCLHINAGKRCDNIIKAHSIQKNGFLSMIAENKHVYIPKNDAFKNEGGTYCLSSINKVSTFRGFCKKHDNELFKHIDVSELIPTKEQVFLYAYRSICKEVFEKEKAVNICNALSLINNKFSNNILNSSTAAQINSYNQLLQHKKAFDKCLEQSDYSQIKYLVFISDQKPFMAFSGIKYPDYDFNANQLQNMENLNENFSLITYCSGLMKTGWCFILAWLYDGSSVCCKFVDSMKTSVKKGNNIADMLFRLALSSENHAFSPTWFKALGDEKEEKLRNNLKIMSSLKIEVPEDYLKNGLENISNWKFNLDKTIENI